MQRTHDIHTGIDLPVPVGTPVLAIEAGTVVWVGPFTGPDAGCPWWLPTDCVLVEGETGVFLYGEIETTCERGQHVEEGEVLGCVLRVLRHDKGMPTSMLHLELYAAGYRDGGEVWKIGEPCPTMLRNPTELIVKIAAEGRRDDGGVTCPRCRAWMRTDKEMARHRQHCIRRSGEEEERNQRVQRLRQCGNFLEAPTACPVCGDRPMLVTGYSIYHGRPDLEHKLFWQCPRKCSQVGCHDGTSVPLGGLATDAMRRARQRAHKAFDAMWGDGVQCSRGNAYRMLAERLGIPVEETHIARFDVQTCDRVVEICAAWKAEREASRDI